MATEGTETVREYLERYLETEIRIFAGHDQLEHIQACFEGRFSEVTGTPAEGSIAGEADAEGEVCALKTQIRRGISVMTEERSDIRDEINSLDNPMQRAILELRYLNGWGWKKIAARLHFGMRTVMRHHTVALEKLAHIGTSDSCIMVPMDQREKAEASGHADISGGCTGAGGGAGDRPGVHGPCGGCGRR